MFPYWFWQFFFFTRAWAPKAVCTRGARPYSFRKEYVLLGASGVQFYISSNSFYSGSVVRCLSFSLWLQVPPGCILSQSLTCKSQRSYAENCHCTLQSQIPQFKNSLCWIFRRKFPFFQFLDQTPSFVTFHPKGALWLTPTNVKFGVILLGPIYSHFFKCLCPLSPVEAVKSSKLLPVEDESASLVFHLLVEARLLSFSWLFPVVQLWILGSSVSSCVACATCWCSY